MDVSLPNKLRLHPSYYVIVVPGSNDIQLQNESRTIRLSPSDSPDSSGLLNRLIATLDSVHTVEEIVQIMQDFDEPQVLDGLRQLYDARLLEDVEPSGPPLSADQRQFYATQLAFLSHFTNGAYAIQERLARSEVTVLGLGPLGALLLSSLADSGVGRLVGVAVPPDVPADVHDRLSQQCASRNHRIAYRGVTLADHSSTSIAEVARGTHLLITTLDRPDPGLLDNANEACLLTRTLCLVAGLRAWEGYVGPTVIPRQTACYKCLDLRMKANLEHYGPYLLYEEHLQAGSHQRVFGSLPQFPHIVADVAASEILKLLTGFSAPTTYGRMFTFNFLTLTTEFQEILKLPRCPACGEPSKHLPMMKPWSE